MATSELPGQPGERFLTEQVEGDRGDNAMRDGPYRVGTREQKGAADLEALRRDIRDGLDSGPAELHDMVSLKAEARARRRMKAVGP